MSFHEAWRLWGLDGGQLGHNLGSCFPHDSYARQSFARRTFAQLPVLHQLFPFLDQKACCMKLPLKSIQRLQNAASQAIMSATWVPHITTVLHNLYQVPGLLKYQAMIVATTILSRCSHCQMKKKTGQKPYRILRN